MRIADPTHICPYTGLRSFTEEESLFFKGRDLQIDQITSLLEQNKFLMVTGASGEGKSSLIYGGIIPNARAGFFKAKYSNWIIADFRPERSPVINMAKSIGEQFHTNPATIETELRRGFSSLIDLYLNSEFYPDAEDDSTGQATGEEKRNSRRKAANLMIIADQFEEFFTNPENFYNEAPSKDSQIVVNLLLETARIALRKNLPVYVVCTMRSDYIGQCSAFRGLPEYIGFSQFFVPRLKRKDLKQVIEEPAVLSGNSISQRLIERLVFDISDGVDQLPILQHALSGIWAAADKGNEEMDLLHYAMVGGMPATELPDEDLQKFQQWFDALSDHHRGFYKETGLGKIIEIHANLLYENAWKYYNEQHTDKQVTQQEAKRVIALSFSCLTKIDNSRAVRNRMSLQEITEIINSPRLTNDVIGDILNIFREEGNSFIRPFKTQDAATQHLLPTSVLDITHESLIRNWNKLNQWANREFEFYSTFQDFQKQLDRWKKSGKSRGYLLPIGPLNFFEHWYNDCKPNQGWIHRYGDKTDDHDASWRRAGETLKDTREFLKRSSRKEIVSRTFVKYGPRKIAAVFAILVMLVLSGFYGYDADQKKNENVIKRVKNQSLKSLQSKSVTLANKATYLLVEERLDSGSLNSYLESLPFKDQVSIAVELYKQLIYYDKQQQSKVKDLAFDISTKNLLQPDSTAGPEFLLTQMNRFLLLLAMDNYYQPSGGREKILSDLTGKAYELVLDFFRDNNLYRPTITTELNMAIHLWLTFGKTTPAKIKALQNTIFPLASVDADAAFNLYYAKGSLESNGRVNFSHNGGYHTLASLFAASGDLDQVLWCFNKLIENNERDYFESPRILNNHLNILGYLYQFGFRDKVPALLQWISSNTSDNPSVTVLRNAVIRSGYITHMYLINIDKDNQDFYRVTHGYMYPNLYFSSRGVFDELTEDYEKAINGISDASQRKFTMAMELKRKAMYYHKYWFDRQLPVDSQRLDNWLKDGVDLYSQIDPTWLESTESSTLSYAGDGVRTYKVKRRNLFIYPDYRDGWFSLSYHSDYLFNFMRRNGLLSTLFRSGEDLQELHSWIARGFNAMVEISPRAYSHPYPFPDEALKNIIAFADQHPEGNQFDKNLPYLLLANHAFEKGDSTGGFGYYQKLDLQNINRSSDKYEYREKEFFLNMMKDLTMNLAVAGKTNEAIILAEKFADNNQRISNYIEMARMVYRKDANPVAFVFLDSAFSNFRKIDYPRIVGSMDSRPRLIRAMSEIGSKEINKNAGDILREITEEIKFSGIKARVAGIADAGNYYLAVTSIPNTLTESQELDCYSAILLEACRQKEKSNGNREWEAMDEYLNWHNTFIYYTTN